MVAAAGAGVAGGVLVRAEGEDEPEGAARLGDVALTVGRVVVFVLLAGWDWVAPCGWDLGLAAGAGAELDPAAPDAAGPEGLDVAEASYRYRLYWRIRLIRLVP